jgi:hypothetical protein
VKVAGEPTQQWSDSEVGELDQHRPRRRRGNGGVANRRGVRIAVAAAAVVAVVGGGGAVAMAMGGGGGGKSTDAASLPKTHGNLTGTIPSPNTSQLQAQVDENARNTVLGRASAAAKGVAGNTPKLTVKGAQPTPTSSSSPGSNSSGGGYPASSPVTSGQAQQIAVQLMPSFGFDPRTQFNSCLKPMWSNESGWSVTAANPSGAYGIPQALPGDKMASAGSDWRTSASTQIKWGLGYIKDRYGTPCDAWSFWQQHSYY